MARVSLSLTFSVFECHQKWQGKHVTADDKSPLTLDLLLADSGKFPFNIVYIDCTNQ